MRGMIPAQAPYEGGEPTMRKGSYSEELVRIVDETHRLVGSREKRPLTLRAVHGEDLQSEKMQQ